MQNPFGGRLSDMSNAENPAPNLHNYVLQQMKAGADKSTITRSVVDRGMDSTEASRAVDIEYRRIAERVQREMVTPGAIQTALLGGLLAAAGGGAIWGLIAIHSKQELGIIALGIGFLAGYLVVWLSGGRKGTSLQAIASVSALLGILAAAFAGILGKRIRQLPVSLLICRAHCRTPSEVVLAVFAAAVIFGWWWVKGC